MRAVLDTNVLVSGLLSRTSTPGRILEHWTFDCFGLLISLPILDEVERTLQKPYFRERLTAGQVIAALELLQRKARLVSIPACSFISAINYLGGDSQPIGPVSDDDA